jgi:hypothetical protein
MIKDTSITEQPHSKSLKYYTCILIHSHTYLKVFILNENTKENAQLSANIYYSYRNI